MEDQKVSEHFNIKELDLDYIVDTAILQNYKFLVDTCMEPIRGHFGVPVMVTSAYRNPLKNHSVGGKTKSYHLAEGGCAAIDFIVAGTGIFIVFEWLRLESKIPFDKIILEYKNGTPVVCHIQTDRTKVPRRKAYIGQTGDGVNYEEVPVI